MKGKKPFNLEKAFEPQRREEREGKSSSYLAIIFHQIGFDLYLLKYLNFFAPFVSLR